MYLQKSHSGMSQYQQDLPHRTVSGTVRWSLCCLLVVLLCYCFMQPTLLFADSPLVTQEIRYHMPEAGEVFLIWGVNGWVVVPEENRPAGTVVKDGVMHTPMVREGDTFVAQVQVSANATMDYGFLITKTRSGAAVYIWEANGEQDYHTIATQDGVIEVQTMLTLAQDQAPAIVTDVPLVTQEIRYHMPEAGEVFLIWGVNGWGVVPEENRPVGTVVKDAVMHTPMVREGDIFVARVQVPSGAAVDYGFLITKKRNGAAIEAVWEGDQAYRIIATQDDVTEVKATLTLAQARELLSVLDLALRLLIETCIIFGIGAILIRVSREHNPRNVMLLLFGLTLLGLVLRLYAAWDWNNCHPNNPERLIGDEPGYDNLARGMLQGLGFNWPGRVPLYPLWLAGVYLFTNGSYNAVPYVQALLGAAVIPLTYALGRRVFGRTVGLMAAFISAISYVLIHQSLHLLSEVLYTPVILLVAITLWDALREPTPRRFCWAGFWVGISNLVRPTLLFFPLAILALLVIVLDKWRAMRYWMIYVLTAMLVVTPWILHNYVRYRAVFPLQTSNAILWQGSPEYYHLIHDQGYTYRRIWAEVLYGPGWEAHDPTGVEGDRWWAKRALRSIAAEPLVYLRYAAEKLGTYWVGDPNADWGDTHVFNYQALRRIGFSQWDAILFMITRALPILALLASFVVRRRWRTLLPIYALLIYTTLLHAATHAEARLSNPFQPLLLTIVAGAVMTTVTTSGVSIPYRRDLTKVTGKIKRLGKSNIIFLSIVAACCLYAGLSLYRNNFVVNGEFFSSKTRSDAATEVWDANGDQVIATQDGVIKVQTMPTVAQDKVTAAVTHAPLVTQEIRYHMPDAGEVFLVWGINGWTVVPEEMRPAGTVLKNGVMLTPMGHEGDTFTAKVQAPAGTAIAYGFLITETRNGTAMGVWEASDDQVIATQDGVIEVQTMLTLAQDQVTAIVTDVPLVTQEIRYHMPEASKVFLVWAIDGWILVPEEVRPAGTILKNGLMFTPMDHEGDTFAAKVQVPSGVTIGYGFLITKTRSGAAIEVWDAHGDTKQEYNTVAGQGSVAEVQAPPWVARYIVVRDIAVLDLDVELLWLGLVLLTGVCVGFVTVAVRAWVIRPSRLIYLRDLLRRLVARDVLKIAVVIITIAVIGFSTVSHYGFSTDEPAGFWRVWQNFDLITEGKTAAGDWKYYGPVFDVAAEIVFQIQGYLRRNFLRQDQGPYSHYYFDRMKVKHSLTFLTSLIAYVSVAGITGIFCGRKYAWFGPVALALFPRFWGLSFFNFKDTPFAALFMFSTYAGAHLVAQYLKVDRVRIGANRVTVTAILYGILAGLLTGIRIGGLIVIFFILIAHIVVRLGKRSIYRDFVHLGAFYVLMFVAWLATTILVHPASWSNPIGWLFEAVGYQSKHIWSGKVLFDGQLISAQALPWYYLPRWIMITVPFILQVSFIFGLILVLTKYAVFSDIQRAGIVLVLLQIFFLPIFAIVKHSTIYDGMRQFLFVLPGIAAISSTSLIWIYRKISIKKLKLLAVIFIIIALSQIGFDMVTLHPYEYVYFNRIFGGLANAHNRYETDYWGLSMREAMEWINKNGNSDTKKVLVGASLDSARIFADFSLTVVELDYNLGEKMKISKPFYYLAMPRYGLPDFFPECEVVYQVVRQGVPLTIVKHCDDHTVAMQGDVAEVVAASTLTQDQTPVSVPDVRLPLLIGLSIVFGIGTILIIQRNSVTLNFKAPLCARRFIYLRDLLREMVARDMKLRYKRSVLGVAWSLLNPLIQMLVFIFLFRRVLPLDIPNYPLFVFSGVLAWNWFQATLTLATGAITDNRELIRRPGFPVAILPVVTVTTHLIHFLLALPILLLFVVLGGGRLTSAILTLPLVILLQFLLILSLGYLVATFHVTFRDTQHLLGVFLMLLFYLTPVFYDASIIPASYQTLYHLNPMVHLLSAYRTILIQGKLPDLRILLALGIFIGGLLWLGHRVFTRASYHFVEEL